MSDVSEAEPVRTKRILETVASVAGSARREDAATEASWILKNGCAIVYANPVRNMNNLST